MSPTLLTSPVTPLGPRRGSARDPRRRWTLVVSVLLHLLALGSLLTARRAEPPMPVAPSYDLVFENGGPPDPPTAPGQQNDAQPEAPTPDLPTATPV